MKKYKKSIHDTRYCSVPELRLDSLLLTLSLQGEDWQYDLRQELHQIRLQLNNQDYLSTVRVLELELLHRSRRAGLVGQLLILPPPLQAGHWHGLVDKANISS